MLRRPLTGLVHAGVALGVAVVAAGCGDSSTTTALSPAHAGIDGGPYVLPDASGSAMGDAATNAPVTDGAPLKADVELDDAALGHSDSGPDGGVASSCASLPARGSSSADAGDTSYSWTSAKTGCLAKPFCQIACSSNFLQGLLDCNAVEGGYYWDFGSVYIRVAGRRGGSCVYDIGLETEGSVHYEECTAAIPVAPWSGLRYFEGTNPPAIFDGLDGCRVITSCSVAPGGPTPCDEGPAAVPTCPQNASAPCRG